MAQTHFLPIPNKDLISSFSFNYYGTRLAVSSLDHHLYVLSSDPDTGKWPEDQDQNLDISPSNTTDQSINPHRKAPNIQAWTAHEGPIIKVIWSDPVHGEILASAGTDGTIRIWEEDTRKFDHSTTNESKPIGNPNGTKSSKPSSKLSPGGWYQQTILADSNRAIRDIGFSPSETSLRLASISTDHHLRLYECLETNSFSSDNWNLIINIDLAVLPSHPSSSSDHLNPNVATITGSSTGTGNTSGIGLQQHPSFTSVRGFDPSVSLNNQKNNPSSSTNFNLMNPLMGLRSSAIPTLSSPLNQSSNNQDVFEPHIESFGGWALSWCPEVYWGDVLATSSGSTGLIRLFKFSPHSQWENFGVLNPLTVSKSSNSNDSVLVSNLNNPNSQRSSSNTTPATAMRASVSPISSLAWAPPCGRDYHLIAAGHRDGRARIWKLIPPGLNPVFNSNHHGLQSPSSPGWSFQLDTELDDHVHQNDLSTSSPSISDGGVGKCDWNVTGTVLTTSGSDGKVRIWKMGYTSRWVNTAEINCMEEENDDEQNNGHNNNTITTGITVN